MARMTAMWQPSSNYVTKPSTDPHMYKWSHLEFIPGSTAQGSYRKLTIPEVPAGTGLKPCAWPPAIPAALQTRLSYAPPVATPTNYYRSAVAAGLGGIDPTL